MAKWSAWANAIYHEFFWPTIIFMCQAVVCNMVKIIQATSNDPVFLSIDRSWIAQPRSLPASEWPVAQRQHKDCRLPLGGRKSRFGLSGRWGNRVCQCHHRWPLSQKRAHLQHGIDSTGSAQVRIVWKHYLVLVQNSIVQGGDPLYAGLLYNRALEAILVHNERVFLK